MKKILATLFLFLFVLEIYSQNELLTKEALKKLPTYENLPDSNFTGVYKVRVENIGHIPLDITKYKNLQQLSLYGNDADFELDTIPDVLYELEKLTLLSFKGTYVDTIVPAISKLKNLEELYLIENRITSLPFSLSSLESLRVLTIDKKVVTIPALPQVKEFNYSSMYYSTDTIALPAEISEMKNLRKLSLEIYGFVDIKKLVSMLKNLQSLEELSFNFSYILKEKDLIELNKLVRVKKITLKDFAPQNPTYFKKYPKIKLAKLDLF